MYRLEKEEEAEEEDDDDEREGTRGGRLRCRRVNGKKRLKERGRKSGEDLAQKRKRGCERNEQDGRTKRRGEAGTRTGTGPRIRRKKKQRVNDPTRSAVPLR